MCCRGPPENWISRPAPSSEHINCASTYFTGLRPSEQIALVLSDIDLAHRIISINKARVFGVDRDKTKTSDDRRVHLYPRALSVLRRQLRLRARLEADGQIDHQHVFFLETGVPFLSLQCPQVRWRKTLRSLNVRYRRWGGRIIRPWRASPLRGRPRRVNLDETHPPNHPGGDVCTPDW